MDEFTLDHLLDRHQPRCLRLKNIYVDSSRFSMCPDPPDLEELRFGSLSSLQILGRMSNLVAINSSTLQHLEIGQVEECCLGDANDNLLTEKFRKGIESYLEDLHGSLYPILSVSSLTLVGLCLLALEDSNVRPIFDWKNLRALVLKSCLQLDGTLSFLQSAIANSDESGGGVNLKSFDLRSEIKTNIVADGLKNFLTSFKGLVHLGLLFEGLQKFSSSLLITLTHHGSTLRRLIWDFRLQKRTSFTKDPSRGRYGNQVVGLISTHCRLLEELGLSLDWPALMESPEKPGTLAKVRQLPINPYFIFAQR